eukprot:GHVP01057897.1.p2 GENE.GHVP01057897.1~~GHVP01057897.1.p2  ORF type:complete len:101 (+),score=10.70 GHVP01057897.1:1428-1730(+)
MNIKNIAPMYAFILARFIFAAEINKTEVCKVNLDKEAEVVYSNPLLSGFSNQLDLDLYNLDEEEEVVYSNPLLSGFSNQLDCSGQRTSSAYAIISMKKPI